jgi:hypothetical protein
MARFAAMASRWRENPKTWHVFPIPITRRDRSVCCSGSADQGEKMAKRWVVGGSMDWVEWLILGLAFPIAIAGYFFEVPRKKSTPDDDEDR